MPTAAPEKTLGAPDTSPDCAFAERMMELADTHGPVLTCEDMGLIEEKWQEEMRGRRCALALMTQSFAEIKEKVIQDRDFAKAVAEVFDWTKDLSLYTGMVELLEKAQWWSMMAITCREDMGELLEEVRAERSKGGKA